MSYGDREGPDGRDNGNGNGSDNGDGVERLSPVDAAMVRAMVDASTHGAGYVRVFADGSCEHVDLKKFYVAEREAPKTRGRPAKWPFAGMGVDEWVQISGRDAVTAQNYVHTYGRKVGKRFTTRTTSAGDLIVRRME